jgi:hypothetical protein
MDDDRRAAPDVVEDQPAGGVHPGERARIVPVGGLEELARHLGRGIAAPDQHSGHRRRHAQLTPDPLRSRDGVRSARPAGGVGSHPASVRRKPDGRQD